MRARPLPPGSFLLDPVSGEQADQNTVSMLRPYPLDALGHGGKVAGMPWLTQTGRILENVVERLPEQILHR
jgi:hypothetical protein